MMVNKGTRIRVQLPRMIWSGDMPVANRFKKSGYYAKNGSKMENRGKVLSRHPEEEQEIIAGVRLCS
jgi:hypothetical protein